MSEELDFWDSMQVSLFGTPEPMSDIGDWATEKYNRGLGYVKGLWDGKFATRANGNSIYPWIDTGDTPVYVLGDLMTSSQNPSDLQAIADNSRIIGVIDSKLNRLNSIKSINEEGLKDWPMTDQSYWEGTGFKPEPGKPVSMYDVKKGLELTRAQLVDSTKNVMNTSSAYDAAKITRTLEATSGLLVGMTAFKPEWTRALMGAHILTDAALGVLQFRGPNQNAGYGFLDILKPYVTMAGIGITSKATEGM